MSLNFTDDDPQPDPELAHKIYGVISQVRASTSSISGPARFHLTIGAEIPYELFLELNDGNPRLGSLPLLGRDVILVVLPIKGSDARPDNGPGAGT